MGGCAGFQSGNGRIMLYSLVPFFRFMLKSSREEGRNPTDPLKNLEPENPERFCCCSNNRSIDFEALKLEKGRSGTAIDIAAVTGGRIPKETGTGLGKIKIPFLAIFDI